TDSSIGLSSARARANASSPHGYQSTGLWACWSRYGLVSLARRLVVTESPDALWSAGEGQRAHGGRDHSAIHPDPDRGARLGVLATNEGQRDRVLQAVGARGTRDGADHRVAGDDLVPALRHRIARDHEAAEVSIHVSAIADADHDLLPG